MNGLKTLSVVAALLCCVQAGAADTTAAVKISEILLYNESNIIYFGTSNPNGWGVAACPDARYVYLQIDEAKKYKLIYDTALIAKIAEQNVSFSGACAGATYLRAGSIFLR